MRRLPTSSAMPLIRRCAASWALPHTRELGGDRSAMGDALHEHMQERAAVGVGEAMTRLERVARHHELGEREAGIFAARCKGFEWCPPVHSFGEVGLALLEDGSVVRVRGSKGQYETPPNTLTAGTLDVMWAEPRPLDLSDPEHPVCPEGSVLWVADYKSGGEAFVEPVEHHAQAHTNALLAARWTGALYVVPALLFIRKGFGEWDVPEIAWGPGDLDRAEHKLREWLTAVRLQQDLAERGLPLAPVEGKHCEFCPARARCSVHTGELRAVLSGTMVPQGDAPLEPQERVYLAEHLRMIEGFARKARAALVADVDANGPIPMSDGNLWGRYDSTITRILVDDAMVVLAEELGPARAAAAVERSIGRDAIEAQVKALHSERGIRRQVALTMRRLYAKMGEAGALLAETKPQYGAFKVKPPEASLEELLEASLEGVGT